MLLETHTHVRKCCECYDVYTWQQIHIVLDKPSYYFETTFSGIS